MLCSFLFIKVDTLKDSFSVVGNNSFFFLPYFSALEIWTLWKQQKKEKSNHFRRKKLWICCEHNMQFSHCFFPQSWESSRPHLKKPFLVFVKDFKVWKVLKKMQRAAWAALQELQMPWRIFSPSRCGAQHVAMTRRSWCHIIVTSLCV